MTMAKVETRKPVSPPVMSAMRMDRSAFTATFPGGRVESESAVRRPPQRKCDTPREREREKVEGQAAFTEEERAEEEVAVGAHGHDLLREARLLGVAGPNDNLEPVHVEGEQPQGQPGVVVAARRRRPAEGPRERGQKVGRVRGEWCRTCIHL